MTPPFSLGPEGPAIAGLALGPANVLAVADLVLWAIAATVPAALLWHTFRQSGPTRRVFSLVAAFAAGSALAQALRALPAVDPSPWATAAGAVAAVAAALAAAAILLYHLSPALATVEQEARGDDRERLILLEAAVTASGDGVMIAEAATAAAPELRIAFANPAFEGMMGYSAEEAVGLSPSVFCHADSSARVLGWAAQDPETELEEAALTTVRAALRSADPVRVEIPGRRKDGTRMWAEWQIVPVADAAGRLAHRVAVIRDTTDRRVLEEQLRESQKMDAVGRLAGGIAHDFNNLLTVIRGNAELLHEAGPGGSADPELIDEIRGAAERAGGLVRQLLTFGRRQAARPVVLDLNVVVGEMAGMLRRLLGERIAVAHTAFPAPIRARIDRGQLEQVVMNLAVNARDAMPGGGTLTITTGTAADPRGTPAARFARLTVADTGSGMTAEVRARIFEPFFTTKGPGGGTGLGLATAYGIVTQAGGKIAVDSAPGHGTTFRVDLPWCDEAAGSTTTLFPVVATVRDPGVGRGRTVLLVEDEDGVRKLARIALEGHGYTVCEAPEAETALGLLVRVPAIHLLVTDLTMPGMGGRELAGRVRAARPEVGVVFISGYAPDIARLDAVPGGIFLAKPFTPADLLKAAGKALARAPRSASTVA